MKFIDLFAGLGGFHVALASLGHKCVFACEIDERLSKLYKINFGITPHLDIKDIPLTYIKKLNADIICAGFPCQPFSKAGNQTGFDHNVAGDMFDELFKVIEACKPKYIFLENVPNLLSHNQGSTYNEIKNKLEAYYNIKESILAPTDFNYPQTRKRLYIVGNLKKSNLPNFNFPKSRFKKSKINFDNILDNDDKKFKYVEKSKIDYLYKWEKLLNAYEKVSTESFLLPLWTMELNANYPLERGTNFNKNLDNFIGYKGSFGKKIKKNIEGKIINLPNYAQTKSFFPKWKIDMIVNSRKFLNKHKQLFIDWVKENSIDQLQNSYQKFEWNAHGEKLTLIDKMISFRGSGIRAKRRNAAPTLIALTTTQIPIIHTGSKNKYKSFRYISQFEGLRLQGFKNVDLKEVPQGRTALYKAVGNAVNVDVVREIAKKIL